MLLAAFMVARASVTIRYDVVLELRPNRTIAPAREADAAIEQQRLRGHVSRDDIEINRPKLIRGFENLRNGFSCRGTLELLQLKNSGTLVRGFAPLLGSASTSPIIEYFDGSMTISANGAIGRKSPNAMLIEKGDARVSYRSLLDLIVLWKEVSINARKLNEPLGGGSVVVIDDPEAGSKAICEIQFDKDSHVRTAKRYFTIAGEKQLDDEITVHEYISRGGEELPSRLTYVRRRRGSIVAIEHWKLADQVPILQPLAELFPTGTPVNDYRRPQSATNYRWEGHVPPLAALPTDESNLQSPRSVWSLPVLAMGFMLIGLSQLLYRRR